MSPRALEEYLYQHIPLARAMQVSVLELSDELAVLGAPLAPNVNHRATVFGGSASAVAILAAWSLLHVRLADRELAAGLVIQRNCIRYERPIAGGFRARAALMQAELWPQFLRTLQRRGKARIVVAARLQGAGADEDADAGHFEGDFVALARPAGSP